MGSLLEGLYSNPILLHIRLSSEHSIRYFIHLTGETVYELVLWSYFLVKIPYHGSRLLHPHLIW